MEKGPGQTQPEIKSKDNEEVNLSDDTKVEASRHRFFYVDPELKEATDEEIEKHFQVQDAKDQEEEQEEGQEEEQEEGQEEEQEHSQWHDALGAALRIRRVKQ